MRSRRNLMRSKKFSVGGVKWPEIIGQGQSFRWACFIKCNQAKIFSGVKNVARKAARDEGMYEKLMRVVKYRRQRMWPPNASLHGVALAKTANAPIMATGVESALCMRH